MKKTYSNQRLGILGGGQLARMLAHEAQRMGYEVHIYSASKNDPAAQVSQFHHLGALTDSRKLMSFLKKVDLATFESEFMDSKLLEKLRLKTKTEIYPRPRHMGKIQDRLSQKRMIDRYKIATSPWLAINNWNDLKVAAEQLGYPFVLKTRRFGYDGYGTQIIKSEKDIDRVSRTVFPKTAFIAEKFIPFKRELALMVARSRTGDIQCLPWVESFQENSRCLWVKGPISSNSKKFKRAETQIKKLLSKESYVGILGIEFFDTGSELYLNELAPRVHNSGHYSQDALVENQFTIHLKAILGLKFSKIALTDKAFAMYNLLGEGSKTMTWNLPANVALHWYGKSDSREGRKMGHLNAVGAKASQCLQTLKRARKEFKI